MYLQMELNFNIDDSSNFLHWEPSSKTFSDWFQGINSPRLSNAPRMTLPQSRLVVQTYSESYLKVFAELSSCTSKTWLGYCCASPETAVPACSCKTSVGNIHKSFALLYVQNYHDLGQRSVQPHSCPEHEQWYALLSVIFDPQCINLWSYMIAYTLISQLAPEKHINYAPEMLLCTLKWQLCCKKKPLFSKV